LYSDSARTIAWPANLGLPGVGTGAVPNTHVIYARIPAVGNAEPGAYSDTITVSVNY
jgi:spore coat protein U-like protein